MRNTLLSFKAPRRLLNTLLMAALALGATAAGAQGKGETVRIQDYPGTGGLTMRVAIAKGYCTKAGITCQLQTIPSGPLGIQAMLTKSIEVATTSTESTVPAVMKGARMKWIANTYVKNVGLMIGGNHVPTPNAGKPFPAWVQDLKGKKVGVSARGSGTETMTRYLLETAGMKAQDVTFVAVGSPVTAYQALVNKQIDFALSFEPAGTMCELTKQCKSIWRADTDTEPAETFATNGSGIGLILTQDYIDANPHVVAALIKAAHDANAFINAPANFEELVKISESFFKFEMPDGDKLTRALLQRQIKIGAHNEHIDRAAVKATIDYMLKSGQWDKAIDVSEFIDSRAP